MSPLFVAAGVDFLGGRGDGRCGLHGRTLLIVADIIADFSLCLPLLSCVPLCGLVDGR